MESACVVGGGAELPGVLTCVFIFGKRLAPSSAHTPPPLPTFPPQLEMPAPSLLEALLGRKGMVAVAELG